jgi:hypothetical protein
MDLPSRCRQLSPLSMSASDLAMGSIPCKLPLASNGGYYVPRVLVGTLIVAAVLFVPIAAFAQQQSMNLWAGAWKRNVAKSTYSPGPTPKFEQTVKLELVNGLLQVTDDGFNAQGQPTHNVFVVNFDGTERMLDTEQGLMRSYRWIDERTYEGINTVKGQQIASIRYVLAKDGRTHTVTTTGKNPRGQTVHNVVVYERQ